jgi:hypothetical protein
MSTKENDLRVWWIPQIPMDAFRVKVDNPYQAKVMLETLAKYDAFQFEKKIKGDYCNTGGLEVFRDGDWEEWTHGETFEFIDEVELSDLFDEYSPLDGER